MESIWAKEDAAGLAFPSEDVDLHHMELGDNDLLVSIQPLPLLCQRWQCSPTLWTTGYSCGKRSWPLSRKVKSFCSIISGYLVKN